MEGLVDYVKRQVWSHVQKNTFFWNHIKQDMFHPQVKCPECRAEHRIPYNGIQGFPTNYTLQKFLELHSEITGEN